MSELPMTAAQFFEIFRTYNEAVWPLPVVWAVLAAAAAWAAIRTRAAVSRLIALYLAALWTWSGFAYLILHHAPHNPIGYVFGGLFIVQALLFLAFGVTRREMTFAPRRDSYGLIGGLLILYALVVYPIAGYILGHRFPAAPTFGVPCPTTIFTFGMLLWAAGTVRWPLFVVPSLWAFIAVFAALGWGVWEDALMPVAAVIAIVMMIRRNRRRPGRASQAPVPDASRARPATASASGRGWRHWLFLVIGGILVVVVGLLPSGDEDRPALSRGSP